eukprot:TRINITY_DN2983_c0_g2_i2.p1 TRINITY_DN2983_c0_g2~~TRINITY_DN2983_c0_g2_i2.p1  ORF type:complete len:233 (+),score=29.28 TRINITY_DN2983_c0_g2_i2:146-844(+)
MHRAIYPDKRYDAYRQDLHVEKVKNMTANIDNSPPPTYSHLESRRKQIELEKQRLAKIAHENAKLTRALVEISTKPSKFQTASEPQKKSLNRGLRQREAERIQAENLAMIKRMIDKPPAFGASNWEAEREKQLKYLANCCEFPVLAHHKKAGKVKKTKDGDAAVKLGELSLSESPWPSSTKKRASPATKKKPASAKKAEEPVLSDSDDDDDDDEKESDGSGSVALSDSEEDD